MIVKVEAVVSASEMATSTEEIQVAVENALTKAVPCQLYGMKVKVRQLSQEEINEIKNQQKSNANSDSNNAGSGNTTEC